MHRTGRDGNAKRMPSMVGPIVIDRHRFKARPSRTDSLPGFALRRTAKSPLKEEVGPTDSRDLCEFKV